MTIVQLEYLIAVHRAQSFSKAAIECNVTQPTLSMQVQKLEEELGILIFDRSKKPVVTTDIGNRVIEESKDLIALSQRIKISVQEHKGELAGELRIGIIPTVAPYLLPFFLPKMNDENLQIQIEENTTENIINKLNSEELDVGIMAISDQFKSLKEHELYSERMIVYCSEGHELLKGKMVETKDLKSEDLWLLSKGHCWRNQNMKVCETLDVVSTRNIRYESGSLDTLMRMVDLYKGYTLVPEMVTHYLTEDQMERVRYFSKNQPGRTIGLVVKREFLKRRLIDHLTDVILESVPKYLIDNKVDQLKVY